jgi:serine protease DegS
VTNSTLRRNVAFVAGSVLAGLVIALLISQLWPRRDAAKVPQTAAEQTDESPAPLVTQSVAAQAVDTPAPATVGPIPVTTNASATGMDTLLAPAGSFAPAVRISAPAVVSVYTQRKVLLPGTQLERVPGGVRQRQREGVQQILGSGVIVDAQGHIITNEHVVKGADQISVQLADGRSAAAIVVGRDPDTDLAVLKIDLPRLPVMTLGRSDRVAVGDQVLAIGNPLGLSQTVTHGIVSATGRAQLGVAHYEDFIQTDAAINAGNSGGALVSARGELIGINTAVLGKDQGAEGLGVAIPVDLVRGVMREILQHGRVVRGWIGIVLADVSAVDAQRAGLPNAGVLVWDLSPDSPARQMGLTRFDKIETIDGQPARYAQDTLARIASRKPGTSVKITGMRGRQPFSVDLKVIERPQSAE